MMKVVLRISAVFIFMMAAAGLRAAEFGYDARKVTAELAPIAKAEQYVITHDADLAALQASGTLSSGVTIRAWDPDEGPPLGIPSFLWGCCLGVIGILLVYVLTDGDRDQTKKALWGCVVGSLSGCVLWGLWYVLIAAAGATG